MEQGDIPVFMVYDQSEDEFYDAKVFNNTTGYDSSASDFPWFNFSNNPEFYVISDLNVFIDCNLDLGGHAFIDSCNYCVEGNTGLNENYADLGCGCDELAPTIYCEDTDNDGLGNPDTQDTYCFNELDWEGVPVEDCSDIYPSCDCDINNEDCFDCEGICNGCLLYTSPSPRDQRGSRMPSSA